MTQSIVILSKVASDGASVNQCDYTRVRTYNLAVALRSLVYHSRRPLLGSIHSCSAALTLPAYDSQNLRQLAFRYIPITPEHRPTQNKRYHTMSPSLKRKSAVELAAADTKKPKQNASITSFFGQPKAAATTTATATATETVVSDPILAADSTAPGATEVDGVLSTAKTPISTVPAATSNTALAALFTPSITTPTKPGKKPFDKEAWIAKLTDEQKELLKLEIDTLDESWLAHLSDEITSKDFLNLKRFLKSEIESKQQIFPPMADVYSWYVCNHHWHTCSHARGLASQEGS